MKFINRLGQIVRGTRQVSGTDNLREEDVRGDKLVQLLRAGFRRIAAIEAVIGPEATEFEVDATDGATVTLQHGFDCPVRFEVTSWRPTREDPVTRFSQSARAMGIGALGNTGANTTAGTRFRLKAARAITGVRFVWNSVGAANTVRCTVWEDSSGTALGTVDVSVNETGVYEAYFTSPIIPAVGTDFTVTVWNTAGAGGNVSYNNDVTYLQNISMSSELTLKDNRLYIAGNARPTNVAVGGHYPVEPILNDNPRGLFQKLSTSDSNKLILRSFCTGKAVVRVEPSQFGVS